MLTFPKPPVVLNKNVAFSDRFNLKEILLGGSGLIYIFWGFFWYCCWSWCSVFQSISFLCHAFNLRGMIFQDDDSLHSNPEQKEKTFLFPVKNIKTTFRETSCLPFNHERGAGLYLMKYREWNQQWERITNIWRSPSTLKTSNIKKKNHCKKISTWGKYWLCKTAASFVH